MAVPFLPRFQLPTFFPCIFSPVFQFKLRSSELFFRVSFPEHTFFLAPSFLPFPDGKWSFLFYTRGHGTIPRRPSCFLTPPLQFSRFDSLTFLTNTPFGPFFHFSRLHIFFPQVLFFFLGLKCLFFLIHRPRKGGASFIQRPCPILLRHPPTLFFQRLVPLSVRTIALPPLEKTVFLPFVCDVNLSSLLAFPCATFFRTNPFSQENGRFSTFPARLPQSASPSPFFRDPFSHLLLLFYASQDSLRISFYTTGEFVQDVASPSPPPLRSPPPCLLFLCTTTFPPPPSPLMLLRSVQVFPESPLFSTPTASLQKIHHHSPTLL